MIPSPNLDDRTFEDLVEEAITLIPKYSPGWTNHNPSDPGVTLVELFAWMTEMVIYRLNKVTDKNYLAFLDLMGISLQQPQPARALLQFDLASKAKGQRVEAGTQVATQQTAAQDAIVFETERDVLVVPTALSKVLSQFKGNYDDHTALINGARTAGFPIFHGEKAVERVFYIGDPRFANLNEAAVLRLNFTSPEAVGTDFPRFCEWQFWNGRRWRELSVSAMAFERGEIVFDSIEAVEPCEVDGKEDFWVRGVLTEVPGSREATLLDTVQTCIEVIGEGVEPDSVLTNDDMGNFIPRDLSKNFPPFGEQPTHDCILYLSSADYLGMPGADIRIEIRLTDPTIKDPPQGSENLVVAWEFYDGKAWQEMARSTPIGLEDAHIGIDYADGTRAFTQSGSVSFKRPDDLAKTSVFGVESYWIRARIAQGSFGEPGQYELDGDRWVWHDENPLRPPFIKAIRINYSEPSQSAANVLSYNDFTYRDHTKLAARAGKNFQPFEPIAEESPSLYFGFDKKLPNSPIPLYINTIETAGHDLDRKFREELMQYFASDAGADLEQRVVWEYSKGTDWVALPITDGTENLTQCGFIDFVGPKDHKKVKRFGHDLYWVRARLEMGGYVELPRVNRVALNCVYALNQRTVGPETLGSSEGTPNQFFHTNYAPVLDDETIWVRERDKPSAEEIEAVKDAVSLDTQVSDVLEQAPEGGWWVRWSCVSSFYASGEHGRHYKKEGLTGRIIFGDGIRGMAPPIGDDNIVTRKYRVGGGTRGNVGSSTITTLKRAISSIDAVHNPFPAGGGSDQESIEAVKERGPYVIRSNYRAVTKDDYEWLAMQASNSVARAACLPCEDREGEVTVIIIPKFDESTSDYREKLSPSTELLRRVRRYLDERRLVTTIVNVQRPRYADVSVHCDVIRASTGSPEKVKREIERALRIFLHPIRGGRDGKGWDFGRSVLKMDLYHVIEEVDGVDFVDRVRLLDEDRNTLVEQIKVGADELPHLVDVVVTEKAREKLL
jgi:phage-related baseplate assembly protein